MLCVRLAGVDLVGLPLDTPANVCLLLRERREGDCGGPCGGRFGPTAGALGLHDIARARPPRSCS